MPTLRTDLTHDKVHEEGTNGENKMLEKGRYESVQW